MSEKIKVKRSQFATFLNTGAEFDESLGKSS